MRRALSILFGVAALSGIAAPALAQTVADKADARCIIVLQLAASREAKNREAAVQGTFYYLGRLTAHGMSGKLEPMLLAESKTITNGTIVQTELTRCGTELNIRSTELRTTFDNLQRATASAPAAPPPAAPPAKK